VWKTDSKTIQTQTTQRNVVAQAIRTTALTEAAQSVADLPQARPPLTATVAPQVQLPLVTHPAVTSLSDSVVVTPPVTYEALTEIRDTLNTAIDQELLRVTDDALFLAINTVRADVNRDISMRLEQIEKTTFRTPDEVLPALVLAADWYDSAARETDIIGRNQITHPGFVPVKTLQVPIR
ncbi:DNA circularization protein, partial [Yersinia enterocolitica]